VQILIGVIGRLGFYWMPSRHSLRASDGAFGESIPTDLVELQVLILVSGRLFSRRSRSASIRQTHTRRLGIGEVGMEGLLFAMLYWTLYTAAIIVSSI
jgi:hypothetical protein